MALNSATFNACRIIGPAITGALLLVVEADLVFAVATATLAQHYVVLFFLRAPGAGGTGTVSMALVRDAWDGMVYAWRHPGIRFLMVCLGITGLLIRPFMEMAPGYASLVFNRGPEGLAVILSSIGAGAMAAALLLAHRGRTDGLTRYVTFSFAMQAISLILFTLTENIFVAVIFLFSVGFFMLAMGVAAQSLIQNDRGPEGLAVILSSIGAGAMAAALLLAHRGRTDGLTRYVTFSFAMQAISLILFTLTENIFVAVIFLFSVGFFMLAMGVAAQSLIQNVVDAAMRARAIGIFVLLSWGMPAFGALVMGWMAAFFGLRPTIAVGAILALIFWLWALREGARHRSVLEAVSEQQSKGERAH